MDNIDCASLNSFYATFIRIIDLKSFIFQAQAVKADLNRHPKRWNDRKKIVADIAKARKLLQSNYKNSKQAHQRRTFAIRRKTKNCSKLCCAK